MTDRIGRFASYSSLLALNGKQAAWANKKYCGHRVLPGESILKELDELRHTDYAI
jgi:hypothetical protein